MGAYLIDSEIKPQLEKIIPDVDAYIPKSFDEIMKFGKTVLQTFEPVCKAFNDLQNKNYYLLLSQPELIVPQLPYIISEPDMKVLLKIRQTLEGTDHIKKGFLCDETCNKLVAHWKDIDAEKRISIRRVVEDEELSRNFWARLFMKKR